jgi:hypothetical protein
MSLTCCGGRRFVYFIIYLSEIYENDIICKVYIFHVLVICVTNLHFTSLISAVILHIKFENHVSFVIKKQQLPPYVYCFVYLRPVCCVINVNDVSGLSIFDCPFRFFV